MSVAPRTTIYSARSILTMNPAQPRATHVAVREGRILGVGSLDAVSYTHLTLPTILLV